MFELRVLNILALVLLCGWVLWLITRRNQEITREARQLFFKPLLAGLTLWCIERVSDAFATDPKLHDAHLMWFAIASVFNAATSFMLFWAGRNLLQLRNRLLRTMQPSRPDPRIWLFWKRFICSRLVLFGMCLLTIAAATVPPLLMVYPFHEYTTIPGKGISDFASSFFYAAAAFAGLFALGIGLTRELNRQRSEFLGLSAGLSVILYSFVQLMVIYEPLVPTAKVLALTLKATFAVAIASYRAMIGEVSNANRERPTLAVFKRRFRDDIHDARGKLDSISNLTQIVRKAMQSGGGMDEIHRSLQQIDDVVALEQKELRRILDTLRGPDALRRESLVPAVNKLVDGLRRDTPIPVVFEAAQGRSILTIREEECFYSVAREASRNAVRHAKGMTSLRVLLDCGRGSLLIEDDGAGLRAVEEEGHGIEMMRNWAAEVGAILRVGSTEPHGTRVTLEVGDDRR